MGAGCEGDYDCVWIVKRGDEDVFVVDLEACGAETLDEGRAVGEVVGEDCVGYSIGLRVGFELSGHGFDRRVTYLFCFEFQRAGFSQLRLRRKLWGPDVGRLFSLGGMPLVCAKINYSPCRGGQV